MAPRMTITTQLKNVLALLDSNTAAATFAAQKFGIGTVSANETLRSCHAMELNVAELEGIILQLQHTSKMAALLTKDLRTHALQEAAKALQETAKAGA